MHLNKRTKIVQDEDGNLNLNQPILPPEIWQKIFRQTYRIPIRFKLANVCSRWNEIVFKEQSIGVVNVVEFVKSDKTRSIFDQLKYLIIKRKRKLAGLVVDCPMNDVVVDISQFDQLFNIIVQFSITDFHVLKFCSRDPNDIENGGGVAVVRMFNHFLTHAVNLRHLELVFENVLRRDFYDNETKCIVPINLSSLSCLESVNIDGFIPESWTPPISLKNLTFNCTYFHPYDSYISDVEWNFAECIQLQYLRLNCPRLRIAKFNMSNLTYLNVGYVGLQRWHPFVFYSPEMQLEGDPGDQGRLILEKLETLKLNIDRSMVESVLDHLSNGCGYLRDVYITVGYFARMVTRARTARAIEQPLYRDHVAHVIKSCPLLKKLVIKNFQCRDDELLGAIVAVFEYRNDSLELLQFGSIIYDSGCSTLFFESLLNRLSTFKKRNVSLKIICEWRDEETEKTTDDYVNRLLDYFNIDFV